MLHLHYNDHNNATNMLYKINSSPFHLHIGHGQHGISSTSSNFRSTFISNTNSTLTTTKTQHNIQYNHTTHWVIHTATCTHALPPCNLPYYHIFYSFTHTTTQTNLHNINKWDETLPFSSNFFTWPIYPNDETNDLSSEIIIPRWRGPLN